MWFSGFFSSHFACHSWSVPMMKITGLSHIFKWENLHNWWLTKNFFAPLYMKINAVDSERVFIAEFITGPSLYCQSKYCILFHQGSKRTDAFSMLYWNPQLFMLWPQQWHVPLSLSRCPTGKQETVPTMQHHHIARRSKARLHVKKMAPALTGLHLHPLLPPFVPHISICSLSICFCWPYVSLGLWSPFRA